MSKASIQTPANEFNPDYVVHPGEVLEYELELREMSRAELAKRTGLSEKHINGILKNKGIAVITPETAIKFERALGMPVDYWLNLEKIYQEARARRAEAVQLEKDLGWLKRVPVNAMAKEGWIPKHGDKRLQLEAVLRFFGIASVSQWNDMWPKVAVAFRQHKKQEIFPEAVAAWLRKGEIESSAISCNPYDKSAFRQVLDRVRNLTVESDPATFVPKLQKLCAESGVAVVVVPSLPKTGVSGATRWVSPEKAILQLSFRFKSNDHFWFTFFHEAGHILLHGKKELFLEGTNGLDVEKEDQANRFAEQELVPRKEFQAFSARTPHTKISIKRFAESIGVAPGVVVGQLQHKGMLPRTHCNELKVRYEWV